MKTAGVNFSLEGRLNALAKKLGIDHRVLWQPDPESKYDAMIFPDRKVIEIYAADESKALEAFGHEVMELRLRDAISYHVEIENTLLTLLQQIAYRKKEDAIDRVIRDLRLIHEDGAREPGEIRTFVKEAEQK